MVNAASPISDQRPRRRTPAPDAEAATLGAAPLNPFGDLHTLQHLSARLARGIRPIWERLLRRELRCAAEPLVVQRFADYRAERGDALAVWLPFAADSGSVRAFAVLDGATLLQLLDQFFGGTGAAPATLPTEFSPAALAMGRRVAEMLAAPLAQAWEPLTRMAFAAGAPETGADLDGEDAVILTRFTIDADSASPLTLDLLYPVAPLKPHAPTLTGKVLDKAEPDPVWRTQLTRAAMAVRFPVRSVLAEPVVSLQLLMDLKPGDVIPIQIAADVPVMVGGDRLGHGTVGVSNGHAAIRLTALALPEGLNP
ncbi:FliM/FliN family flagellar motor switch protein [Sphingomonas abaci]|uniref:Flagellar motor switch protein FliM n=1 Tax=Sphingomonas abaci TaxID=237611 RepID=A0A7W7AMX7_9SPHN|nr:flagellar motor switch protein FliM [Sphingomonas abaci]MBB4619109.1 flagellar motor switch protein FliM [Sphingomonas abaci]